MRPASVVTRGRARARPAIVAALASLLALAGADPSRAQTNDIFPVAGTGSAGFSGDGVMATSAQLNLPVDVEVAADGAYLIVDQGNQRVRRVAPDGTITTVAGTGASGFSGDNGPATAAQLSIPNAVAATADGGFLIADSNNHRVRRVSLAGTITTVAGTGSPGFSGDSGPATAAQLNFPAGIAVTADGGYLIADNDNHRVRRVSAGGTITTVAGTGAPGFAGDNGPANAAQLNDPGGVAVAADGGYLIADINNHRVRRVSADGTITTLAGTGAAGFSGDGGPAAAAQLDNPIGVAVTGDGGALIADRLNHRVRRVTPAGLITTVAGTGTEGFAGDGGAATSAQLNRPIGVAVTPGGDYLVADTSNHVVRLVDAGGLGPPPPPLPAADFSLAVGPNGPSTGSLVVVAPGGRATVPVVARRNVTSAGRIRLSAANLPPGVSASFAPAELAGREEGPATMTLAAEPGAAPVRKPITVVGTPVDGSSGAAERTLSLNLLVQGLLAARVEGIEITQAVQTNEQPQFTTYGGVALVAHKKTVVRVFADFVGREPASGRRPAFGMALFVTEPSGRAKPGSPIFPEWIPDPADLSLNDLDLTQLERDSAVRAFTFVLPDAWTHEPLRLEARVLGDTASQPAALGSVLCLSTACGATPSRELTGITFRDPPAAAAISLLQQLVVTHVLKDPNNPKLGPDPSGRVTGINAYATTPAQALAKLQALSPVPFSFLDSADRAAPWPRFRATRFASDTAIWEPADAFDEEIGRPGLGTVGLFVLGDNPGVRIGRTAVVSVRTLSPGVLWRPVTSVAHEIFHLLAFKHTSAECGSGASQSDRSWPVPLGRMDSVGIDTTPSSGGPGANAPPYRIIPDEVANQGFDLMSYCGIMSGDAPHWISARNWNRALGLAPPPRRRRFDDLRVLEIQARVLAGQASIVSVGRATGAAPDLGQPSPFSVVARDARGRVLATSAATQETGEGGAGFESLDVVHARVPIDGVDRVELVSGGVVVAARDRSRAVPRVRFAAPGRGQRVGTGRAVTVRWRALDGDRDALAVALDYSADGGRTFRNVWSGPDRGGVAQVPTEYLDATARARLRLRVSDGFNETSAISAPFVVVARPPRVEILEPARGQRPEAGGTILLRAAAVDDRGRTMDGRRLRWLANGRIVARGALASAALPAGTRRLTLEATDAAGRKGSAVVGLAVRSTTPFFVRLTAPSRVSRRARSVTLIVSATQPSVLRVGGRRFRVGRATARLRVPVAAGRSALRLQLTLSAGGKSSRRTLAISR